MVVNNSHPELQEILQGISQEKSWNTQNTDDTMQEMGKEKIESLKIIVEDIVSLIMSREKLSNEINRDCDKLKIEIENFLLQNKPLDDDEEDSKERADLRRKKIDISELQIKEKVSCWQDVSLLKKELRERQRELTEKVSRMEMLDKILEE